MGQAKNMRLIKCHKFRELNTALQNIRAEQSVCTSLDENAVTRSVLLGSNNVRKGGGLKTIEQLYGIVQVYTFLDKHP